MVLAGNTYCYPPEGLESNHGDKLVAFPLKISKGSGEGAIAKDARYFYSPQIPPLVTLHIVGNLQGQESV